MADVSDPSVAAAYQEVRSDSNPTTWAVFGYSGKTNKVVLQTKGESGWSDFVNALKDDEAQYGFFRFTTGDSESKRAKFLFVSWVGANVGRLVRARVSVHKADVKSIVRDYAAEIHAEERAELDEEKAKDKVVKAGGAAYGSGNRE